MSRRRSTDKDDDGRHKSNRYPDHDPGTRRGRRPPPRRQQTWYESLDFSQKLAAAGLGDVPTEPFMISPIFTDRDDKPTIRIRALQYMVICDLRRELAVLTAEIHRDRRATTAQMEELRITTHQYVQALSDLRFMLEPQSQNKRVARFLENRLYIREGDEDGEVLLEAGLVAADQKGLNPYLRISSYKGQGGFTDRRENAKDMMNAFLSRALMALFGGIALIAPMLIMVLHPTLLTTLLTSSVFVIVVGILLAWFMTDAEKKDILGATAAYAAVLVVFIGTNGSSGG